MSGWFVAAALLGLLAPAAHQAVPEAVPQAPQAVPAPLVQEGEGAVPPAVPQLPSGVPDPLDLPGPLGSMVAREPVHVHVDARSDPVDGLLSPEPAKPPPAQERPPAMPDAPLQEETAAGPAAQPTLAQDAFQPAPWQPPFQPLPAAGVPARAAAPAAAAPVPVAFPVLPLLGALAALLLVPLALWPRARRLVAAAPLFTRVSRADALAHPLRRRLLQRLADHPGLALRDLMADLDASRGSLLHHLDVLERHGLVRGLRVGRRVLYFTAGEAEAAGLAVLRDARTRRLAAYVLANPGCGQREAGRALGIAPSRVHDHLRRLCAAGLVSSRLQGRRCGMSPAAPLGGLLAVLGVA